MDFNSFVDGPLLWVVFLLFVAGIGTRLSFFLRAVIGSSRGKDVRWRYCLTTSAGLFLPFHRALAKRPFYATLRYVFHLCLFVVPIWLGGHIVLWEESRFGWQWAALPDAWADGMTLVLLGLAAYFLFRRIVLRDLRLDSSKSDYVLIFMAAIPFVTGFFLAHGTLDAISFFKDNMQTIHVLSAEAMLVLAAFLFVKSRLNERTCTGCASCELSCPTGTLESNDQGENRVFSYSHYQCICCGACVKVCPEEAAELRHEISTGSLLKASSKEQIRSVKLKVCERCGALFAPIPQLDKIGQLTDFDYIGVCERCKKSNLADIILKRIPVPSR